MPLRRMNVSFALSMLLVLSPLSAWGMEQNAFHCREDGVSAVAEGASDLELEFPETEGDRLPSEADSSSADDGSEGVAEDEALSSSSGADDEAEELEQNSAPEPKGVLEEGAPDLGLSSESQETVGQSADHTIVEDASLGELVQSEEFLDLLEGEAPDTQSPDRVELFRLYNPNSGEHFYTSSVSERNNLIALGWNYEGIGWVSPKVSSVPVYRLYNPNAGDHHYTMSLNERDWLVSLGWNYEGIGWYSDVEKTVPVFRQYNPYALAGSHNYTTNKGENDQLVRVGWNEEGIGWFASAAGPAITSFGWRNGGWQPYASGVSGYSVLLDHGILKGMDGSVRLGFVKAEAATLYADPSSGRMTKGWATIEGRTYWFDNDGVMAVGDRMVDGKTYRFASDGSLVVGWEMIEGNWYWFDPSGSKVTGWKTIEGKTYLFAADGHMLTGWQQVGDSTYWLDSSGALARGWKTIGGATYWFRFPGQDGNRVTDH